VLENGQWEVFGNLKSPRHGQCQAKLGIKAIYFLTANLGALAPENHDKTNTNIQFHSRKICFANRRRHLGHQARTQYRRIRQPGERHGFHQIDTNA